MSGATGGPEPILPPMLQQVPRPVQLAMALMPAFTVPALEAIETSARPLNDVLKQLDREGLIEADPGALSSSAAARRRRRSSQVPAIRLGGSLSAEILSPYLSIESTQAGTLRTECVRIAERITDPSLLPDVAQKWSVLASHATDSVALVQQFDDAIETASQQQDSATILNWMESAQSLASILKRDQDGSLALALQRAGRQVELLGRERADRRRLETFYPRRDQINRLTSFVQGSSRQWQLHLLGPGGVGKTMLLRHFALEMAETHGFLTARVDFDFLSPDYPRLDPGLLLWSLSRELRLRDRGELATKRFKDADTLFKQLRDELRGGTNLPPSGRPTDHPLMPEIIGVFCDALRALPTPTSPKPIVLVLDTCEELLKGRARGGPVDGIDETFRILGALKHGAAYLAHEVPCWDGVESLRVLFAGRRPLASSGAGWTSKSESLKPREELEFCELCGFHPHEAADWLAQTFGVTDPKMVKAVITVTPPIKQAVHVVRTDGTAPPEAGLNPYDLKHFAEWAREDPPPDPAVVASGSNPLYIQHRVLTRLDDPRMERLLPAIALLKHFDRPLLSQAVEWRERDRGDFSRLFDLLVDHEWIRRRDSTAAGTDDERLLYEVEEGLRRRLWKHYEEEAHLNVASMAERLWPLVEERTTTWEPERLDTSDFDAALRVACFRPDGREWWDGIVKRLARERDFNWLVQLTDFLLGEGQAAAAEDPDSPLAIPRHPLRADVLATHAAALYQTGRTTEARSAWLVVDTIWREVGTIVKAPAVGRLQLRGRLGRWIAVPPVSAEELGHAVDAWPASWQRVWPLLDLDLCATFVAALEAIVECGENLLRDKPTHVRDRLSSLFENTQRIPFVAQLSSVPGDARARTWLLAFATSLMARAAAYAQMPDVESLFRDSVIHARAVELLIEARTLLLPGTELPVWIDWIAPPHLRRRVVVEAVRHGVLTANDGSQLIVRDDAARLSTPIVTSSDDDRLLALELETRARERLPDFRREFPDLRASAIDLTATTPRQRVCNAHRVVPPRAFVLARLAAESGDLAYGIGFFTDVLRASQQRQPHELLHAERMLATLMARFRLPWRALPRLTPSADAHDRMLAAYAELVCRPVDAAAGPFLPDSSLIERVRKSFEPTAVPRDKEPRGLHRERALSLLVLGDVIAFANPSEGLGLLDEAWLSFGRVDDGIGMLMVRARQAVVIASSRELRSESGRLAAALIACRDTYRAVRETLSPENRPQEHESGDPLPNIDVSAITPQWLSSQGYWAPWLTRMTLCRLLQRNLESGRDGFTDAERAHLTATLDRQLDLVMLIQQGNAEPAQGMAEPASHAAGRPVESEAAAREAAAREAAARETAAREAAPREVAAREARAPASPGEDRTFRQTPAHVSMEKPRPAAPKRKQSVVGAVLTLAGLAAGWLVLREFINIQLIVATIGRVLPFHVGGDQGDMLSVHFAGWMLWLSLAAAASFGAVKVVERHLQRQVQVEIEAEDRAQSIALRLSVVQSPLLWIRRKVVHAWVARFTYDPASQLAYRQLALSTRAKHADLLNVRRFTSDGSLRGDLRMSGDLSQRFPWEAFVAVYADIPPDKLRLARLVLTPARSRPARTFADDTPSVRIVTAADEAFSFAQAQWRAKHVADFDRAAQGRRKGRRPSSARVLHIIGDAYGTGTEVRIRSGARSSDFDDYEDAADLATWHPETQVAIVQGALRLVHAALRQDSDRRDAAYLRKFAGELADAGIRTVIVLPSLPATLAAAVLQPIITRAATTGTTGHDRWLDAIAAARRVFRDTALPDDVRFELACDTVLFLHL